MDNEIRHQLKIKKVSKMKHPIILMNDIDFNDMKKRLESVMHNFELGDNPKYSGIPVKTSEYVERNSVIVYDDSEF